MLSTGNELLDIQTPQRLDSDGWGGIWDTNRPSMQAALEGMGYKVVDLGIVPDELSLCLAFDFGSRLNCAAASTSTSEP